MKIILSDLIQSVSGTIDGITYVTRNGKTFAYRRKPKPSYRPSPKRIAQQDRFTLAQRQTSEIMRTTYLRARYETQWKKNQTKFHTLRGYIFHLMYEKI